MPLCISFQKSNPFPDTVTTMDISSAGLAAAADVYFSFWIFLIAVHECIFQRFPESQLDLELFSRNALSPFNQPHQAVHQW